MTPAVIDLHCDLLSYLHGQTGADPFNNNDIGCSLPLLAEGNVKLQIMAMYTATGKGSTDSALNQSLIFKDLLARYNDRLTLINDSRTLKTISTSKKIGVVAAIENASGFCEEDDSLEKGFMNLEAIITNTEKIIYIGLTHHGENRFGGGNSTAIGLKDDGKALLEYINGKKIAIDFSHTSDALANDILEYTAKNNLDIPVLASHSNFRAIFDHPRNLPDSIAKEIIKRNGVIGINFLRAFVNNDNPNALFDHIEYGLELGAEICFGADYFYTNDHPDPSRKPFYFKEHENAGCYPSVLKKLSERISSDQIKNISYKNALNYMTRIWS